MAPESDRPLFYHLIYVAEACAGGGGCSNSVAQRLHAHFGTNSAEVAMLARVLGGPPYSSRFMDLTSSCGLWAWKRRFRRAAFAVAISCFGRSQL